MMNQSKVSKLATCAVMLALACILSLIKVFEMPLGGSITLLSMLPICVLSIRYGLKWGLFSAFCYSLAQIGLSFGELMSWGMNGKTWAGCLIFDYVLAYTVLGLAGAFRKHGATGICAGIAMALVLRFVCHFISGTIFFAMWCPEGWSVVPYSICYNGAYMLPEMALTMAGAVALFKIPQTTKLIAAN